MGGLTSLASTAIQAIGAANTVIGAVNSAKSGQQEYNQAKAKSALDLQNLQAESALQKQQIQIEAANAETERRDALRRVLAKQRAQFGASGIDQGDGSSQAVLLGLFDESDQERAQREALDALKSASIDQKYSAQQRVNTLALTQLREKNKLSNVTNSLGSIGTIGSVLLS